MNLAEELTRLAELRDSGVLTQGEFASRKKQLLNGGRSGSSALTTFAAGLVVAVILGSLAMKVGDRVWPRNLACESPVVQQTALNAINQQVNGLRSNAGILGSHLPPPGGQSDRLSDIRELHRDADTGFVACVASARLGGSDWDVGYTAAWIDRAGGDFWVEMVHHKDLGNRYLRN